MALKMLNYEFFVQKSMEMNRNEYKLPEYSQKQFDQVKKKLNIRKEIVKEPIIKPTTLGKQDEVIATLFKHFNKITEKTYDKLSDEIFAIIVENVSDNDKVCATFFRVILNNSFFCHLYAKLFKRVIGIADEFASVLEKQISGHVNEIKNIIYVSPNDDYDKYCDYVKQVESVKNFTSFLIQCLKQDVLKSDVIVELTITFQKCCLNGIDNDDSLLLNEIYLANIALIIKDSHNMICNHEKWDAIVVNHMKLVESQGCGINKKMRFKLLDISEQIQK